MADTVTKLTNHTFKVEKLVEETKDYTILKSRRAFFVAELAKIDALIALGDSVGVVERAAPLQPAPIEVPKG